MASSSKEDEWIDINPLSIKDKEYMELEAYRLESIQKSYKLILNHCTSYLDRFPNGTYKGWIAHLHPENIKLDSRLDPNMSPENNWIKVWNEKINERDNRTSFLKRLTRRAKGKSKKYKRRNRSRKK